MKNRVLPITILITIICFGFKTNNPNVHFQIKKQNPAIGLTLGWSLPEEQLQKIVGDKLKPVIKNGKGFLMLFITTSKKYYLDTTAYSNLKLAHIVVLVEGDHTINSPEIITIKNQELNKNLKAHQFKLEIGKIDLNLNYKNDSIVLDALLATKKGSIELNATFANKQGDLMNIESSTISATNNPTYYFSGPESFKPIKINEINIKSTGENWITKFKLPTKPDKVWMNSDFIWDFIFTKK